jgi:hypothetical protein
MNAASANHSCPYFGLLDDADTSLTYPSASSGCYRCTPVSIPDLEHQTEYCLSGNHSQCPTFLGHQAFSALLPSYLQVSHDYEKHRERGLPKTFFFALIGIIAITGLGWALSNLGFGALKSSSIFSETRSQIIPSSNPRGDTEIPIIMVPVASAVPNTQSAVLTSTIPSIETYVVTPLTLSTPVVALSEHRLDVPIGTNQKFVIHRVANGENFNRYADQYNTSVEAIVAVNYNLRSPAWVGSLVVIPVGFTDVAGLPAFEAYEVTQSGVSLETLALDLDAKLEDVQYYNAISDEESLTVGDWLLIPHF